MLAPRPDRQKPCPALCFQNAEQGLWRREFESLQTYGFAGVAAGVAAAGAAAPPSFGVAR